MTLPDFQSLGPYTILDEISRGGMGVIYRARHHNGTMVALKLMLQAQDSMESLERFVRESNFLTQLSHKNLIKVYDAGVHDGYPYFSMELVQGHDLKSIVQESLRTKDSVPDLKWLVRVFREIAVALQYIHSQGILHRDLKPHNILIEDKTDRVVLIDFGVARQTGAAGESLTQTGAFLGTPAYASPEQFEGDKSKVSQASDVWGLGTSFFHALTGQRPFKGEGAFDIIRSIITAPTPDPQEHNPEIPESLASLCQQCMTREIEDRPTLEDFIETLDFWDANSVEEESVDDERFTQDSGITWLPIAVGLISIALLVGLGVFFTQGEKVNHKFEVNVQERSGERSVQVRGSTTAKGTVSISLSERPLKKFDIDNQGQFQGRVDLDEGLNEITIELKSIDGAIKKVDRAVTVDSIPPSIELSDFPSHKVIPTKKRVIEFVGIVKDDNLKDLKINGQAVFLKQGSFKHKIEIREPVFPVRFVARDHFGHETFKEITIKLEVPKVQPKKPKVNMSDLRDWTRWNKIDKASQDAIISRVTKKLGDGYEYLETKVYSCPGAPYVNNPLGQGAVQKTKGQILSCRIASYRHKKTGIRMNLIPGGWFSIGVHFIREEASYFMRPKLGPKREALSQRQFEERVRIELPNSHILIPPFLVGATEVTQEQWAKLDPKFKVTNKNLPRVSVSLAEAFNWVRKADLRLLSESEWEYAARGMSIWRFCFSNDLNKAGDTQKIWFKDSSEGRLRSVDEHSSVTNAFGLSDCLGNASEWVSDYHAPHLRGFDGAKPRKMKHGRTGRGGSFKSPLIDIRVTSRRKRVTNGRQSFLGFRVAKSLD